MSIATGPGPGGRSLLARFILADQATPPRTQQPPELGELAPRERQVLLLIAEGLSNAEIAGHLYLSEATVKTPVTRLLAKPGLRDRVEARRPRLRNQPDHARLKDR